MTRILILGREPAALVALIQGALALAVSFGWLTGIGLRGQDDVALVVALLSAVAAVYLGWVTDRTILAPIIEATKAALALGVIYGLTLNTEQTGLLVTFITIAVGFFQRTQVSPLTTPSFRT